jgi:hypothetical protein
MFLNIIQSLEIPSLIHFLLPSFFFLLAPGSFCHFLLAFLDNSLITGQNLLSLTDYDDFARQSNTVLLVFVELVERVVVLITQFGMDLFTELRKHLFYILTDPVYSLRSHILENVFEQEIGRQQFTKHFWLILECLKKFLKSDKPIPINFILLVKLNDTIKHLKSALCPSIRHLMQQA